RNYLEQKIKEYQIEDIVERTGWLSYEKVGAALSNCSIGIIFLELTRENNIFSSPNKLFNYMRYGLPIVTVDLPEIRRIVLESQCGIVVRERTVNALADALSTLIENMDLRRHLGENGKKAVIDMYNWGVMEKRLLRIYDELISSPKYIM
ncbi:MAG: glycosyltransferase, partial [Candidatus Methanomethylicaceae archaeon]